MHRHDEPTVVHTPPRRTTSRCEDARRRNTGPEDGYGGDVPLLPLPSATPRKILPAWVLRFDRRAASKINSVRGVPVIDRNLSRLSHTADHGLLWVAVAGGLALAGQRRAAVRGALSLGFASAMANIVGKRLFGGNRPLIDDVPIERRLRSQPLSASFPSGHAACAAGFVTGVGLESPRAAVALVPLAATVSWSRLHVGAHWTSDVVGGLIIGTGVALLGKAAVPAHRR